LSRYAPPKAAALAKPARSGLRRRHKLRTYLDNL
jgi:hypothetical protein